MARETPGRRRRSPLLRRTRKPRHGGKRCRPRSGRPRLARLRSPERAKTCLSGTKGKSSRPPPGPREEYLSRKRRNHPERRKGSGRSSRLGRTGVCLGEGLVPDLPALEVAGFREARSKALFHLRRLEERPQHCRGPCRHADDTGDTGHRSGMYAWSWGHCPRLATWCPRDQLQQCRESRRFTTS